MSLWYWLKFWIEYCFWIERKHCHRQNVTSLSLLSLFKLLWILSKDNCYYYKITFSSLSSSSFSSIFIHLIHFYPFSSTFIHFHPFLSIVINFIHFYPFVSTFIYFSPQSSILGMCTNLLSSQGSRFKQQQQQPGVPGGSDRPDPLLHPAPDQLCRSGHPLLPDRRPQDGCCCRTSAAASSRCCSQADCSQVQFQDKDQFKSVSFQVSPQIACIGGRIVILVAFVRLFSTVRFQIWL